MEKVKICGFGETGRNVLCALRARENIEICYIDNNNYNFDNNIPIENRILLSNSFDIEHMGSLFRMQLSFKNQTVQDKIQKYLLDASLLILVMKFGDGMSMVVMELLKVLEKNNIGVPVMVMGLLPIEREMESYSYDMLTNRMINFLRNCKCIGWSVVDEERIFEKFRGNIKKTLQQSSNWLLRMVDACINVVEVAEKDWKCFGLKMIKKNIIETLFRGLVYFSFCEIVNEKKCVEEEPIKNNGYYSYIPNLQSEMVICLVDTKNFTTKDTFEYLCRVRKNFSENSAFFWAGKDQENIGGNYRTMFISSGEEITGYRIL